MQSTAAPFAPWGTIALAAGNVVGFAFAGAAPDYAGALLDGDPEVPSIGRLLVDIVRHAGPAMSAVTVLVLVPSSVAVERIVGPVGVVSIYIVSGFACSFAEVLTRSDDVTVAGAFGGTTAILVMWSSHRWLAERDFVLALTISAGWFWSMAVLRDDGFPLLGAVVAALVGLYGTGAVGAGRVEGEP